VATVGATARLAVIDGVGHAAHLEAPDAVAEVVLDFLADAGV
jgi:pimeloyl-ACP methyl ester carboxylesterase